MPFQDLLQRWFGATRCVAKGHPSSRSQESSGCHVPRSPSADGAIRAAPLHAVLDAHRELLARIRVAYGGEEGSFETYLLPVIQRYARFVHLLPATRDTHFRVEGGLLHCGLEVGLHAMGAADAQIIAAASTVPERRALEPRWRTAAFIAGLCAEFHRAVAGARVESADRACWNPYVDSLTGWLEAKACDRYFVRWSELSETSHAATLVVLPQILPSSVIAYLTATQRTIFEQLLGSLAGSRDAGGGPLETIVQGALARVVDRDLRCSPISYPAPIPKSGGDQRALEPALSEGMRSEAVSPDASPLAVNAELPGAPAEGAVVGEPARCDTPIDAASSGATHSSATAGAQPRSRALALPAALNPAVAEVLATLLDPSRSGVADEGIEFSREGIYVPLAAWERRGLDTGLVVRTLGDTRLLVLNGGRKVWRRRRAGDEELGIMLSPILAV